MLRACICACVFCVFAYACSQEELVPFELLQCVWTPLVPDAVALCVPTVWLQQGGCSTTLLCYACWACRLCCQCCRTCVRAACVRQTVRPDQHRHSRPKLCRLCFCSGTGTHQFHTSVEYLLMWMCSTGCLLAPHRRLTRCSWCLQVDASVCLLLWMWGAFVCTGPVCASVRLVMCM